MSQRNPELERLIKKILAGTIASFLVIGFFIGYIKTALIYTAIFTTLTTIKLYRMYTMTPKERRQKRREGGLSGLLC